MQYCPINKKSPFFLGAQNTSTFLDTQDDALTKTKERRVEEEDIFVADNACVIGDVGLGKKVNIWFGVVIRGDDNQIIINEGTNVQDNAVIHVDKYFSTHIGRYVTIGHGAIVHGCTIEELCIIGMGAILLNGCVIKKHSIVAAGSVVSEGKIIPESSVVMGIPGKPARYVSEEEYCFFQKSADSYIKKADIYRQHLQRLQEKKID